MSYNQDDVLKVIFTKVLKFCEEKIWYNFYMPVTKLVWESGPDYDSLNDLLDFMEQPSEQRF